MIPREILSWLLRWWLFVCLFSDCIAGQSGEDRGEGYEDELYCPQTRVHHCLAKRVLVYGEIPKWAASKADLWVCLPEEYDFIPIIAGVQVPPLPWGVKYGEERKQALLNSNYEVRYCGSYVEPVQDPPLTQSSWMFLALLLGMGPVSLALAEWQRIHLAKAKKRQNRATLLGTSPDGSGDAGDGGIGGDTLVPPASTPPPAKPKEKKERVAYYDFWRCMCVFLAVYTHSDETHIRHNTLMGQMWVLPLLSMISGRLFARSRATTLFYASRLLAYFSIGCLLNFLASLSQGTKWWTSFHRNIAFQMPYVLLLAGFGVFSTPLKQQLQTGQSTSRRRAVTTLLSYGIAAAFSFVLQVCLWTFKKVWVLESSPGLDQIIRLLCESFGGYLVVSIWVFGTVQAGRESKGLVGWMHLAWIYFWRIAHAEVRPGSEFHLGDLYVWACVIELEPLAGRKELGFALLKWWPVATILCGLVTIPGFEGRHDQYPWHSPIDRVRQYFPEAVGMIAFVTIPEVSVKEGAVAMPQGFRDHMSWASNWSLFTFLIHKAVYKVAPQPYAIIGVASTGIIPFLLHSRRLARKKAAEVPPTDDGRGEIEMPPDSADSPSVLSTGSHIELMPFTGTELEPAGLGSSKQRLLV